MLFFGHVVMAMSFQKVCKWSKIAQFSYQSAPTEQLQYQKLYSKTLIIKFLLKKHYPPL